MTTRTIGWVIAFASMAASGCVSQGKYDQAVAQTQTTRAELGRANAQLGRTGSELAASTAEIAHLEDMIAEASRSSTRDQFSSDRRISEMRKRLDELKTAHAAADARAALFRDIAVRLKKQIDDGDLTIIVRDGRMVLQLPNDVLFDTGRTELKIPGQTALRAIAAVIESLPDRHFQVAGHTDSVPIHNERFASNWELSSARALRVVHFLIEHRVAPAALSAAGYSDVDPISANNTPVGRKHNRRTEIALQPNIDELVSVP